MYTIKSKIEKKQYLMPPEYYMLHLSIMTVCVIQLCSMGTQAEREIELVMRVREIISTSSPSLCCLLASARFFFSLFLSPSK